MKKILICVFFTLQVIIVYATPNSIPTANLSLYCNNDMVECGNQKLMPTQEYIFTDGAKINVTQENAQPIIMINGLYEPSIQSINKNNVLFVPIRIISEKLGLKINWIAKSNKITIENDSLTISLKINDKIAFVNNKKHTLESPPILVNNTTYVPLRFISEKIGLEVKYYEPSEIDLFRWNPLVTIDKKLNIPYISEEDAYKDLKNKLNFAYNNFEHNYKELYNPSNDLLTDSMNRLSEDIDKIKFTKTISRYYVFEGLDYTVYFDKYTGTIYLNTIAVSFSEIKEADFEDPKLFQYSYMVE